MTEAEFAKLITTAARQAAEEKVKYNHFIQAYPGQVNDELEIAKTYPGYYRQLSEKYSGAGDKALQLLSEFPAKDLMKWLQGYSKEGPEERAKSVEASKIMPLLYGVAKEGRSWYELPSDAIKGTGAEMGYDVGTKEGFNEFLKLVGDYQNKYNRGQLLKKYRDQVGTAKYVLSSLMYPSTMKEIENAIATGEGSEDAIESMRNMEAAVNLGTAAIPALKILRNPVANAVLDAALQGGVEAIRQGATQGLSETGQEFDLVPVVGTVAAGATRPGLIGTASTAVGAVPGKATKDFSRGIVQATRGGNPMLQERDKVERIMREFMNAGNLKVSTHSRNAFNVPGGSSRVALEVPAEEAGKLIESNKGYDMLMELIYGNNKNNVRRADNIVLNARGDKKASDEIIRKALEEYDRPISVPVITKSGANGVESFSIPSEGDYDMSLPIGEFMSSALSSEAPRGVLLTVNDFRPYTKHVKISEPYPNSRSLNKTAQEVFENMFPAKMSYARGQNAAAKAGERTGTALGDIGSSFEPALKVNPFSGVSQFEPKDVKDKPWYRAMNKQQRAAFDAAFKKKLEEDESE